MADAASSERVARRLCDSGLPLAACAFGMALRLHHLGAESLWYDETVSAYLADLPVKEMLAHTALDIHPPGYYLLLHLWTALAGNTEYALAFLSLAFGVAAIAVVYRITKRLAGRSAAAVAAVLAATSAYSVWYSQEVRMYTVAALLMLGLFAASLRLMEDNQPTGYRWIAWSVLAAASLYTVYYSLFLIPLLSLGWLVRALRETEYRKSRLTLWLAAHGLLLLLYLPWLPTALRQALDPPVPPWRSAIPLVETLTQGSSALAFGESAHERWWPAALALLLLALPSLKRASGRSSCSSGWPAAAFIGPWALMLTASAVQPLFHPRYLLPFAAFFAISLAQGLAICATRPVGRWLAGAALALYLMGNFASVYRMWTLPDYRADDLRGAVQTIAERWVPGDVVLSQAGYTYTALIYYWPGPVSWLGRVTAYDGARADAGPVVLQGGSLEADGNPGWEDPGADFFGTGLEETAEGIERALSANRRLWVFRLYDTVTDPSGQVREWLSRSLVALSDEPIPGPSFGRLQSYVPPQSRPCSETVTWGDLVETCVEVGSPFGANGSERLPVYLSTRELSAPSGTPVHYTLRLQSPEGTTVGQSDGALTLAPPENSEQASGFSSYVLNPLSLRLPEVPADAYGVILGLYTFEEGTPVPLLPTDASGAALTEPDGLLEIGHTPVP